jgi:pSer/pThr/pTyr-binding forkhead associated (FHA) protein
MPYHLHLPGEIDTVVKPLVPGKKCVSPRYTCSTRVAATHSLGTAHIVGTRRFHALQLLLTATISPPRLTVGRKDCAFIIPNDASISRTHCTFVAGADHEGVTVHDSSKFGVTVDGEKLDPKNKNGQVVLRGASQVSCEIKFGCAKPAVYTATLVFTENEHIEQEASDATTDAEANDDTREEENNSRENEAPVQPVRPVEVPVTPLARPQHTQLATGEKWEEGKATTVFEALSERRVGGGNDRVSNASNQSTVNLVNFKKFKKQRIGPSDGTAVGQTNNQNGRHPRRTVLRYADEAYDALPQWEDASVAATHAAERADAQTAEEMFVEERRTQKKKPAPRRRGAAARGK